MDSYLVPQLDFRGKSFQLAVPSSKSIANRALILAAHSRGDFFLKGDFAAEDIQLMITALRQLGVGIEERDDGVQVNNDLSWKEQEGDLELFLGNSGTSIRFLTTLVCFRRGKTILTGKDRMKERPIGDLVDALRQLGVGIEYLEQEGYPPLLVKGNPQPAGGEVKIKGNVSSQYLTSLLLSAPCFREGMTIEVVGELISRPYVDITLALLKQWGVTSSEEGARIRVESCELKGFDYEVEGDASAATYWWALSAVQGADIQVVNVPEDSVQGDVRFREVCESAWSGSQSSWDMNDMPDASLTLMAMAPLLKDATKITNIGSLRVKETDRIDAMATELRKLGVEVETGEDWILIHPLNVENSDAPHNVQIATYDDHRVAMSMAVLGTCLGHVEILDPSCVEKSYPRFWEDLEGLTPSA